MLWRRWAGWASVPVVDDERTERLSSGPAVGRDVGRRRFLRAAGGVGLAGFVAPLLSPAAARAAGSTPDGTPEQVHLTWGSEPMTSVTVSWASLAQAVRPRVSLAVHGTSASVSVPAVQRSYTDGLNGETVFCYHAALTGLEPDTSYDYTVLSDNSSAASPVGGRFSTAPPAGSPFRFTSYGDLATPNTRWVLSYGQAAYAVGAVETFRPLFHLLNGDLCYANLNPSYQPEVWRDFNNNNQASARNRPWMPCPGNHEIEFYSGPQGFASYLTRYSLPDNGTAYPGRWYSFQVANVMFVSLSADDVSYQDGGAFVGGTTPLTPAPSTGNPTLAPGAAAYIRGYSGGAQTTWLRQTLAAARADSSVDWIVVQMHQDALSSSSTGNGSDRGIREEWLPLFDQYQVDLVVCGHDHDYERSFPVRGQDSAAGRDASTGAPVDTRRPRPITTVDTPAHIDTSQGTVHLILGGGGTSAPLDAYGTDTGTGLRQAKVFTKRNAPKQSPSGSWSKPGADAVEDAVWSARTDPDTGYGIAVFDVDPGTTPGGQTSITVTYYHATGADPRNPNTGATGAPNPDYSVLETFTLVRPKSDGPPVAVPEFGNAALAVAGAAALGVAAAHRRGAAPAAPDPGAGTGPTSAV